MRLPLLFALLLTLPVPPAVAQHNDGRHAGAASFHVLRHGHFFRFRGGPAATFLPGYWGWNGDWAWDDTWAMDGAAAPRRQARLAAETPPSTETTPQGVTIIRGPGSRHLPP
ncbi:MAG TPA: hypothetical protein VEI03_05155 [Stellaceae bacterium]|nr:hypothetical protein [Stellaceae bacterium]